MLADEAMTSCTKGIPSSRDSAMAPDPVTDMVIVPSGMEPDPSASENSMATVERTLDMCLW